MDLADVHTILVGELRERVALVAEGHPMAEMTETFEELSIRFEALALCHLLESVDRDKLAENLCRSGHARRFFLRRSQEQGNVDDMRLALGRTNAFLAALAAGDLALARDIAALSITEWQPDWEYEDDFCFFLFLHRIVLGHAAGASPPEPALTPIVDRFAGVLAGADAPRLAICRALLRRDPAAFARALVRRLAEIGSELDVERTTGAVQERLDVGFWPRSAVSIEGLALLRVAELLGVAVDGDPPMCPRLARLPVRPNDYLDFFTELERGD